MTKILMMRLRSLDRAWVEIFGDATGPIQASIPLRIEKAGVQGAGFFANTQLA